MSSGSLTCSRSCSTAAVRSRRCSPYTAADPRGTRGGSFMSPSPRSGDDHEWMPEPGWSWRPCVPVHASRAAAARGRSVRDRSRGSRSPGRGIARVPGCPQQRGTEVDRQIGRSALRAQRSRSRRSQAMKRACSSVTFSAPSLSRSATQLACARATVLRMTRPHPLSRTRRATSSTNESDPASSVWLDELAPPRHPWCAAWRRPGRS